jgi:hypothetical protein
MTEEQKDLLNSLGTHEITTYLRNNRNTAFILWQTEDVIGKANEMGFEMSEEEAEDIISSIDNSSDCEYGITWETIKHNINEWIEENTFQVIIQESDTGEKREVKFCSLNTNENIEEFWNDDEYYKYGYSIEEVENSIEKLLDNDKVLEIIK